MLRLILLLLLGFVLIRAIRAVMIALKRSSQGDDSRRPSTTRAGEKQFTDIRDAKFEDITAPKQSGTDSR